jgi:hypothetical protein
MTTANRRALHPGKLGGLRGAVSGVFGRNAEPETEQVQVTPAAATPRAAASMTETLEAFRAAAVEVPAITDVVARSQGEHLDFVVTATGAWYDAIAELEPKLTDLIASRLADFDYRVRRPGDDDPVGFSPVFHRG